MAININNCSFSFVMKSSSFGSQAIPWVGFGGNQFQICKSMRKITEPKTGFSWNQLLFRHIKCALSYSNFCQVIRNSSDRRHMVHSWHDSLSNLLFFISLLNLLCHYLLIFCLCAAVDWLINFWVHVKFVMHGTIVQIVTGVEVTTGNCLPDASRYLFCHTSNNTSNIAKSDVNINHSFMRNDDVMYFRNVCLLFRYTLELIKYYLAIKASFECG